MLSRQIRIIRLSYAAKPHWSIPSFVNPEAFAIILRPTKPACASWTAAINCPSWTAVKTGVGSKPMIVFGRVKSQKQMQRPIRAAWGQSMSPTPPLPKYSIRNPSHAIITKLATMERDWNAYIPVPTLLWRSRCLNYIVINRIKKVWLKNLSLGVWMIALHEFVITCLVLVLSPTC